MAKVNFLDQAESFMSESHISQFHGNANKNFIQGVTKRKIQEKNGRRFAERKQKMNTLKIKC